MLPRLERVQLRNHGRRVRKRPVATAPDGTNAVGRKRPHGCGHHAVARDAPRVTCDAGRKPRKTSGVGRRLARIRHKAHDQGPSALLRGTRKRWREGRDVPRPKLGPNRVGPLRRERRERRIGTSTNPTWNP